MVLKKHYKPNVAYELLIDGKYHYYGCHCRNKALLYESEIRGLSGNRLAALCNTGKMSREEYNERVKTVCIWEFDSAQAALDKETELITKGKETYGDLCLNECIGNNKSFSHSEESKERSRKRIRENPRLMKLAYISGLKGASGGRKNKYAMERSRAVSQYDGDNLIATFPSVHSASVQTGIDGSNIRKVAQHKKQFAGGFRWEFA